MKNNFILFFLLLCSFYGMAQNGINYKAVVKDGSGNIVANELIQVQFSILEGVTVVYAESHVPTTDANGLVLLNIGEGTPISGTFDTIDWASDEHFLNVQINTGDGLVDMGTTQFKQVPYAISSGDAVFEKDGANAYKLTGNIGLGTSTPQEQIHISDVNESSILLSTDNTVDSSSIKFENGNPPGAHTSYRLENRNDTFRLAVDSDLTTGSGYADIMTISTAGFLTLANGASVNEFSTDGTFSGNSNNTVPTERAVKTYVDSRTSPSKTIIIPATSFTGNQSVNTINYRNFGAYAQYDAGSGHLGAPLMIPVGATVTSVTFYLRDNTNLGNVNLELGLLRSFRGAATPSVLFTLTTFATTFEISYNTSFTIATDFQYFFRVRPTSSWDNELGINSVKITYTE